MIGVTSNLPQTTRKIEKTASNATPIQAAVGEQTQLKGFQLSPKSYVGPAFSEFFEDSQNLGNTAMGWSGSVSELNKSNSAAQTLFSLSTKYKFTPVIIVQSYDRKTNKLLADFVSNAQTELVTFAEKNKPAYIGIGIEVNLLYDKNKSEFEKFVSMFAKDVKAIKQVSPDTKVFTIFQYEQLQGLKGGLFGGKNDTKKANWKLLDKFPAADLIGITTYPTLIYKTPANMPSNYYAALYKHTKKPIFFTEIGWLRTKTIPGWEGSPQEQANFLNRLGAQTHKDQTVGYLWSFFYDQAAAKPFDGMGLRGINDTAPALSESAWKSL